MRFAILGSGSRGNATVVSAQDTHLLVDCGFSRKEIDLRLARCDLGAAQLAGILVTHEHSDHVSGVARLSRAYQLPFYLTRGTALAAGLADEPLARLISPHQPFAIGAITVQPYPVPHDAREPVQFVLQHGSRRLGILSDAGAVTAHMREVLSGCDALLLECNHCPQMLADGPYPPALKDRVGGRLGHLSNAQSAALLGALDRSRLRHLAVTHISEKNNCPQRATQALVAVLGEHPAWLAVADQDLGLDWRDLEAVA